MDVSELAPIALRPLAPSAPSSEPARTESATAPGDDEVSISTAARRLAEGTDTEDDEHDSERGDRELTEEQQQQVRELQARDREVRAHEQAHKAAAGDLASGGPSYEYEVGPDGRRYAVGGEVQIQLRDGRTPEETLANMQRVQRAALAVQEPSTQDRAVAAEAAARAQEAQREIHAERAGGSDEPKPERPGVDLLA